MNESSEYKEMNHSVLPSPVISPASKAWIHLRLKERNGTITGSTVKRLSLISCCCPFSEGSWASNMKKHYCIEASEADRPELKTHLFLFWGGGKC
jgi:hypothetical protein